MLRLLREYHELALVRVATETTEILLIIILRDSNLSLTNQNQVLNFIVHQKWKRQEKPV